MKKIMIFNIKYAVFSKDLKFQRHESSYLQSFRGAIFGLKVLKTTYTCFLAYDIKFI